MTRDAIIQLFARREEAWKRLDPVALAADHAEDGIFESPMAGLVTGRAEIERVYRTWCTAFPDFRRQQDLLLIEDDRAAEFGVTFGTDTGGFMGLPPTGKAIQVSLALLYLFGDGQIVRFRSVYDFTGLLVQVGILKARPV